MIVLAGAAPVAAQTGAPGGFLETTTSTQVRPRVIPSLPTRGPFTFPAPYNTQGVRITNAATDCGGADCVDYIGYSYWRNINNHVGSNTMLLFVTLDRARGGGGPTLFSYDKTTDQVTKVGPLFDPSSAFSWGTGEGWYWSPTQPTKLYVNSGAVLYRYDVNTRQFETVFDASTQFGSNRYIWQTHTSDDDTVHSATLRDSTSYDMLGCMVYSETTQKFSFFAKTGDFDECQIDKSGRWLLIKEQVDGKNGEDNVIVNVPTGQQTIFYDQDGAPGHSDNGYGYMVGEDNWYALPGAARVWQFGQPLPGVPPQGLLVYHTTDWAVDLGHVSHANARAGVPAAQQYACLSHASRSSLPRANEIVCFRLDGSLQVLVVAPVMTDLNASGGGSDDYSKIPMGNLDITGQYFIWTSNVGTSRQDAFIVKVPSQLLVSSSGDSGGGGGGGGTGDTTPPTVSITSPAGSTTLSGTVSLSATASDNVGVAGVQFKLDGSNLGAEITSSPYSKNWDTTAVADGTHTLIAVARDLAGNTAVSANVSVNVSNGSSGPVSIITPTTGAVVSGTVSIMTANSGAIAIAGVQFKLNGTNLGAEITTSPFSMTWDTTTTADGPYTLTAVARDVTGITTTSPGVAITVANTVGGGGGTGGGGGGNGTGGGGTGGPQSVTWTSLVNVSATGNSLQKTGGCDGCADAGATSTLTIPSGPVSMTFTASETNTLRYIGLAVRNTGTSADKIRFAFALQPTGIAEIRERGNYRAETPYVPGDVLKITVQSRVVQYYKNDTLIYQSTQRARYPLRVNTSLLSMDSTIEDVVFGNAQ